MKQTSRLLLLLHGIGLILSLAVYALQCITGLERGHFLLSVLMMVSVLILVSIGVFTHFTFAARFYRTIFSNEGYLTNTLPVTTGQILLSRFYTALIWGFADLILLFLYVSLIFRINFFNMFADYLPVITGNLGFFLLILLLFILEVIVTILTLFGAIAIGNLFGGHKIIGSIISYFFLNFVLQIISLIPFLFFLKDLMKVPSGSYGLFEFQRAYPTAFHSIEMVLGAETILYLLCIGVLYWLTWHLMDKKLNLE